MVKVVSHKKQDIQLIILWPGFGDEVSPLATEYGSFGHDYREPGDRPAQSSTVGESNNYISWWW